MSRESSAARLLLSYPPGRMSSCDAHRKMPFLLEECNLRSCTRKADRTAPPSAAASSAPGSGSHSTHPKIRASPARKRAAVPALPTSITASPRNPARPQPVTVTHFFLPLSTAVKPSATRHARKCLESSENRTFHAHRPCGQHHKKRAVRHALRSRHGYLPVHPAGLFIFSQGISLS